MTDPRPYHIYVEGRRFVVTIRNGRVKHIRERILARRDTADNPQWQEFVFWPHGRRSSKPGTLVGSIIAQAHERMRADGLL